MRFLFLLGLLFGTSAMADDALQHCTGIDDDSARLVCYDAAAGRNQPVKSHTRPMVQTEQKPPAKTRPPEPAPAAAVEDDMDEFGVEHVQESRGGDSITSRYDGEFTGWSGRTLFKLENGQVWRQAESGRYRTTLDRPVITIERAAFGSYRLKVEGLNRTIRVKRVR